MDNQSIHVVNSKELRIGNLINYPFVGIRPIRSGADIDSVFEDGGTPIPLSPEWLERCGFEDDKHGRWTGPQFETDTTIQWFEIEEDDRQKGFYWLRGSEWVMGRPFQFLHQLQNLYFALTGEELTIKETV